MSRIQQILEKAEKDGTARRVPDSLTERSAPPPASGPFSVPPRFEARATTPVEAIPPVATTVVRREAVVATPSPLLVAALQPQSDAAEQYRALRSRIARAEAGQAIRVIQITSPAKHDGKSVTALNLALTMAQEFQRRVIVIDADLRRPSLHHLLGLPPGPGLVDVLTGTATLDEALVEIDEYRLTVLRAGGTCDRPAEMLGSAEMRRLIDTLRAEFDRIVIDSAPAIVADPGAVATLADRLLLVVRAGSTTKPAIAHAIQTLGASKLLGLVFNASGGLQKEYAASA